MINKLQKGLWILTGTAPILMAFSIVWYINKGTYMTSIIAAAAAVLLLLSACILFSVIKIKLPHLEFNADSVTQSDGVIIGYIASYLMPFASVAFDDYNPYIFLAAALVIFLMKIRGNSPAANPLLFFVGYHYYEAGIENGIGNYLVISKKTIRNKNQIKNVIRITEYLLLDI
ncbi:MAG: hypothetical protein ACOZCL_17785 [Bacillota bacterium]